MQRIPPFKHSLTFRGVQRTPPSTPHHINTPWPWRGLQRAPSSTPQTLPDLQGSGKTKTKKNFTPQTLPDLQGNAKNPILHPSNTPWPWGKCKEPHSQPHLVGSANSPLPPPRLPNLLGAWGGGGGAKGPNSTQHKLTNPVESLPHRHTVCCSPALQWRTKQLWAGSWWVLMSLYTLSPFESGSGRRRKRCLTHSLPPNLVLEEKKKGGKKRGLSCSRKMSYT